MNHPSPNRFFLVIVAAFATAIGSPGAMSGGDDDLDRKIDSAMVGVRSDRPWHVPGSPSMNNPIQLRSYAPASAVTIENRQMARWRYSLTPFFWTPGISGTIQAGNNSVNVDESIGEFLSSVIDNFDFAAMARFEADYCRWSILFDFIYIGLGDTESGQTPAGAPVNVDWTYDSLIADLFAGYRFAEVPLGCGDACFKPTATFDALAGFRGYHFEVSVDLDPGPDADGSRNWVDPVVGARALFHVTPALTFNAMANIGGFGVGSDLSWQLIVGLDYKVANCVSLDAGWAVLSIDYQHGNANYDLTLSGPYLARRSDSESSSGLRRCRLRRRRGCTGRRDLTAGVPESRAKRSVSEAVGPTLNHGGSDAVAALTRRLAGGEDATGGRGSDGGGPETSEAERERGSGSGTNISAEAPR